jgi:hypothetical protein
LVREYFVTSEANKKVILDMIIYSAVFFFTTVSFFCISIIKKNKAGKFKFIFALGKTIFALVSLFNLFGLARLIYQNTENIISELMYVKDFFRFNYGFGTGRTGLHKFLGELVQALIFISSLTFVITFFSLKIKEKRLNFFICFALKQKAINEQVIDHHEIKGFLYKALP